MPLAIRLFVGMTCWLVTGPKVISAPAPSPAERTPAPLLMDDGFTRESLLEFDAPPEPPPLKTVPAATAEESAPVGMHHHHQRHHTPASSEDRSRDVVVKSAHRRNPLESVIYWWNGWVVKNFHTRNGTVLLDTIGAKT